MQTEEACERADHNSFVEERTETKTGGNRTVKKNAIEEILGFVCCSQLIH